MDVGENVAMSSEEAAGILEAKASKSIGTHSFKATMILWSGWCACAFTNNERLAFPA